MYNRIHLFLAILLCCVFYKTKAQPTLDTLKNCIKQTPHLFGKLDSRNSFISNSRAKIFGIKAGLNYGNRLHFGIGYNQLNPSPSSFNKQVYFINSNNLTDSSTALLKLFYISGHVEYIYYQTKHWQLSLPIQAGLGKTYYQYKQSEEKKEVENAVFFIYEPAVSVEYKFVKWVGLGVDVGFRFIITDYKKLNQKLNSPIYAFKLLIYYNEIYRSLKHVIQDKTAKN